MDLGFLAHASFWVALGQIILIDILLGGDNAVVIALACRKLPPAQRSKGIVYGTAAAIVLRVILIVFAMSLLQLPALKLIGGLLLLWIGIKLLAPEEESHSAVQGNDRLWAAVKTIIVADLVMSVDNVIAIAAAAQGAQQEQQVLLVSLGLLISIPIIVWGSQLVIRWMARFPRMVIAGGMLLGWIAGGMLVTDPLFLHPTQWLWAPKWGTSWGSLDAQTGQAQLAPLLSWGAQIAGALLVLLVGMGRRR